MICARGRREMLLGDRVVIRLGRDGLHQRLVEGGAEDVFHLRLVRRPRLLHRVVHGIGDRRQPAVGLHRLRIVERRAGHRRTAVFPGELELGIARGEPLQELHRAFRILGARGDRRR